jgi:Sulfotransferase domain
LSTLDPLPQIAFILRKPSDRVYSYFQFLRNNLALVDPGLSFRDYVSLAFVSESRLPKQSDPRETIARSRYVNYLATWTNCFPSSHIHVLLFEELVRDERSFMRRIAATIGIEPRFYDSYSFPRENPTYEVRSHWLHQRRRRLARLLPPKTRKLVRRMGKGAYSRVNIKPGSRPRPADDAEVLAELERAFAAYNQRLAREMNLDLTLWS